MFTQQRKENASRAPDHSARITPSLSVSVWQSQDTETGKSRLHWTVNRQNPKDPSVSYRTMRVESLLEFPAYLAKVALGFSEVNSLSPELRTELVAFAAEMQAVADKRAQNRSDNGNGVKAESGFRF